MESISVHELSEVLTAHNQHALLIDVREPDEYSEVHIEGSRTIPCAQVAAFVPTLAGAEVVYVHCARGGRSTAVCTALEKAGVHAVNVEGGIVAWEAAGFPVVRARS